MQSNDVFGKRLYKAKQNAFLVINSITTKDDAFSTESKSVFCIENYIFVYLYKLFPRQKYINYLYTSYHQHFLASNKLWPPQFPSNL
jgi:hypothetical protein